MFLQICSQLHPRDLLHLMRTSTLLRLFLRTRSRRHVWVASLHKLDRLPPCPTGLDEPVYAALLFGSSCQV
ncbi:hypothetical protein DFH09DRAFT_849002, partial [Mycena vulgaris]